MAATCTTNINQYGLFDSSSLPHTCANQSTINTGLSIFFAIFGAICVFMIVIGGIRYITARSSPDAVARAKNMIVYSLIGLIIAASAEGFVNVVLERLK